MLSYFLKFFRIKKERSAQAFGEADKEEKMTCIEERYSRGPIVVELNNLGLSQIAIAEVLSVSNGTIQTDFELIGIKSKSGSISLKDVLRLAQCRFDEIEKALLWPVVRERNYLLDQTSKALARYLDLSPA